MNGCQDLIDSLNLYEHVGVVTAANACKYPCSPNEVSVKVVSTVTPLVADTKDFT